MKHILIIFGCFCLLALAIIAGYYDWCVPCLGGLLIMIHNHTVDWITTCLTVGSILFMVQTFIVPYTKENVYDKQKYITYIKAFFPNDYEKEQYRPLKNLSNSLLLSILSSLLSAVFIIFGLISCFFTYAAIFCGGISILGLFFSLYAMRETFNHMFGKFKKTD